MARKKRKQQDPPVDNVGVEAGDATDDEIAEPEPDVERPADSAPTAEPVADERERLVAELEEAKDRYLRLAAEFDNFRKRRAREQLEERERSQGQLLSGLLETLDDLARVAHVEPDQAAVAEFIQGVELVERKLLRQLEIAGLVRVGAAGEPFDPNLHEAVASVPASTPEEDHTIAAVLQKGYRFHKQLLRPARVQVCLWSGDEN